LVVTDVGSLAEMVRPGQTGLVVPPRDAESLASAIARIVDAPELGLAMAQEAASLGRGQLSWKAIAAGSSRVYRSALAGNSK
jgi:glycosyltransferase involved in cell wall biosynthesis